ncbi:DUF1330 domain-containing protein [Parvularcula lutaonensis]|uniref:DUF1330 domain-containing protein n=1 Tax=Parvularcula lutaonensis TaxID=491923 RepID=A0ABV7MAS4_9PROT|nr:DUF1330 domain-containing protein [Parvularcula lutaonensis]GGY38549.1 hypothetical protein GCM10007148_03580 [Parvularcula lutaonensis]
MAAYMIVFAAVHDRERFFRNYAKPTAELIENYGGEYVLRAPGVESLEGGLFDGASAVISRWPDKAAIMKFWNSPEYEALKSARQPLCDAHVMVVEEPA